MSRLACSIVHWLTWWERTAQTRYRWRELLCVLSKFEVDTYRNCGGKPSLRCLFCPVRLQLFGCFLDDVVTNLPVKDERSASARIDHQCTDACHSILKSNLSVNIKTGGPSSLARRVSSVLQARCTLKSLSVAELLRAESRLAAAGLRKRPSWMVTEFLQQGLCQHIGRSQQDSARRKSSCRNCPWNPTHSARWH